VVLNDERMHMTFGLLQSVVKGLMIGDNNPPTDKNIYIGLLSYAYNMIGNKAESFHLLTLNRRQDLLRMASGDYFMRVPELPTNDEDELDIDNELGYVAARYICSMISDKKMQLHEAKAEDLIRDYNGKVYQIFENIKYNYKTKEAEYSGGRSLDDYVQIPDPGVIQ
jgi:hypothetical protein